ncbi:protein Flattop-like [Saccoglossus kowalevskii]|uniref:Cilia- and flagella-associated protein 126 n=1 Tax=Saccoglossus kowalevskii TaxID=10224 RepID=A0ABM0GMJ2_SACKO|nr:PREDICTED: UPF0740 protein v1g200856-like [Saccoglossus kowalevskii]
MATHFNANQYDDAFAANRLQNWTVPHQYKERPSSLEGYTQIIANDRGHLLSGVPRSQSSPWGNFVGTWDMPRKIPGNVTSYMARSDKAIDGIETTKEDFDRKMYEAVNTPPKCADKATSPLNTPAPVVKPDVERDLASPKPPTPQPE